MNVLSTITSYPPALGGAQQHFHEVALRLQRTEELRVIRQWDRNRQDWLLGSTVFAPRVQPVAVEGIITRGLNFSLLDRMLMTPVLPWFYGAPQIFTPWVSHFFLKRIREIEFRPDLIHHGRVGRENLGLASAKRARELEIPFVLTPFHHPRWVGWRYRQWLDLYRRADHVFALTEAESKTLVSLGVCSDRVTVVGHGPTVLATANAARFRKRHGLGSHPVVLFLGQKYLYKGFTQIRDSAAVVWKEFPETRFVFVGPRTQESTRVFAHGLRDSRIVEMDSVSLEEKSMRSRLATSSPWSPPRRASAEFTSRRGCIRNPWSGAEYQLSPTSLMTGRTGCWWNRMLLPLRRRSSPSSAIRRRRRRSAVPATRKPIESSRGKQSPRECAKRTGKIIQRHRRELHA